MKGRTPTADEKRWLNSVGELGCIVCREFLDVYTEASPHHIEGRTKPGAHFLTIGLCGRHHQVPCPTGSYATRHGPGRRAGKKVFEESYGTEEELLERTKEILND